MANMYENWDGATIYINTAFLSWIIGDDDMLESILIHEMGHVLKLCHPKETSGFPVFNGSRDNYDNDNSVCSVMNHNTGENLFCKRPKKHDMINLINKWED